MIKDAIAKVVDRLDLTEAEAEAAMHEIMEGQATPAQIAAYVTALRMKGEAVDEVTGSARAMRAKAVRIHTTDPIVVDTCGTGGDGGATFNVSTAVAFVVAGAGVTVAKHGNRAVSSRSGSADALKALGVRLDLPPERAEECVNEIGIGFLFAPLYHGAMRHAVGPRQGFGGRRCGGERADYPGHPLRARRPAPAACARQRRAGAGCVREGGDLAGWGGAGADDRPVRGGDGQAGAPDQVDEPLNAP